MIKTTFRGRFSSLYFFLAFLIIPFSIWSQNTLVTELVGSPPDFSDWTTVSIDTQGDEIILTQAQSDQAGALFYSTPYNLNQCLKWKVEFDFRMYGGNPHADGMAFWFLENPPTSFGGGQALGMPGDSYGLKVAFDTYDNDSGLPGHRPNPELQVYYGLGYDETFPEPDMLKYYAPDLVSDFYQHAVIRWDNGEIEITIDGDVMLTGVPTPFDGVENITEGYFGFSASTGLYFDRQSIKNVKVYIDILDLETDFVELSQCDFDGNGFGIFDLTSAENDFIDEEEAVFEYFLDYGDALDGINPIDDPQNFENQQEGADEYIYVKVANENGCSTVAFLHLTFDEPIETLVDQVELEGQCLQEDNFNFDLTSSLVDFVENPQDFDIYFFENEEDALEGNPDNSLDNPEEFSAGSGETIIYVRINSQQGACFVLVHIILNVFETPVINETQDLQACGADQAFIFDLTQQENLILGDQNSDDFEILYFLSQEDAEENQQALENPQQFEKIDAGCETIYIRVQNKDFNECFVTGNFEVCATQILVNIPDDIEICVMDEMEAIDLTLIQNEILNDLNQEEFSLEFYYSLEDAENSENSLEEPENYLPENESQEIFFRVQSLNNSDFFEINSFNINLYFVSIYESLISLETCLDEDFNLFLVEADLDLLSDQEITGFFENLEDFRAGNQISNPQHYQAEDESVIYVSVQGSDQICPEVYSINLNKKECELFIPEGFSPNGDGINDYFEISNLESFPDFNLKIYTRYGQLVYQGKNMDEPWDGTKKGKELHTGVYYYVLDLNQNNRIEKGWVYLNR